MAADAWVAIGGVLLVGMTGSFRWARQDDQTAATHQKRTAAAIEVNNRWDQYE
jgi:hypothetical protein